MKLKRITDKFGRSTSQVRAGYVKHPVTKMASGVSIDAFRPIRLVKTRIGPLLLSSLLLSWPAGASWATTEDTTPILDDPFLSRLTIAVPFFTRHYPNDQYFNDKNWGGTLFYAVDDDFSLVGGDFINSYRRNTAFAGLSITPWNFSLSGVQITPGLMLALDLNGGYRGYNAVDPLLGAATIKIGGNYFRDPDYQFLNRFGLLMTVIPGIGNDTSAAFNVALTFHL